MSAQVHVDLPASWQRLSIAADGDRRGQQELLGSMSPDVAAPDLVRLLVRHSRDAFRDGVAFAAVLLELAAAPAGTTAGTEHASVRHVLLSGSMTVAFRQLPGQHDPMVAAEGTLAALRAPYLPTRRLELIGLGRDRDRPAVLLREETVAPHHPALPLRAAQVLWLVPGSSQLACVTVTTSARGLAEEFRDVALAAAASLRVTTPQVTGA